MVAQTGWRPCGRGEWKALGDWLVTLALEHDTPWWYSAKPSNASAPSTSCVPARTA